MCVSMDEISKPNRHVPDIESSKNSVGLSVELVIN